VERIALLPPQHIASMDKPSIKFDGPSILIFSGILLALLAVAYLFAGAR